MLVTTSRHKILVVGASGATGLRVVKQLLELDLHVTIIVRCVNSFPKSILNHHRLRATQSTLLEMSDAELQKMVQGCTAVISCLGHNLTFKGLYGHPRRLVTQAVCRLCQAIKTVNTGDPVKFILMNTTGNQNKQAGEHVSFAQRLVVGVIRYLIPPHADNEAAAAYLQTYQGTKDQVHNNIIEWVVVRPDSLINDETVSAYTLYPSPIRSAIFDAGKTSRINVAHFMTQLVVCGSTWQSWRFKMPVIYNS
ncbi:NAD(P)-dependent oxidoreductase [Algibacillus agarilyticus]|uniref:NAD(P)-dependent oxidoreductase n=1 Tax=Algibacillus agarilyticus TaxID=2234133 RepID=UPI000DD03D23|nr:NAD(P)-binding oxidoreductase [Algibacillus agarilyticus]